MSVESLWILDKLDDILEGRRYKTHRRRFDPELGRMSFVFEKR